MKGARLELGSQTEITDGVECSGASELGQEPGRD